MAQTDLTKYAAALLEAGITEDQILATGCIKSGSSWYSYNNRELAAFERIEAAVAAEKAAPATSAPKGWSNRSRSNGGHYGTTCFMCGSREVSPGVCDNC